ncbi:MAG: maleylpyruvate isomerase N-terminal domain-containing protein [Mycobacterium sp.]|nr:maleylpyruvate isomerase N-terminal domain-containing protein [Mycobacterium sp.]
MLTGVMAAFEGIVARFVSSSGAFGQKLAAVGPGQWNWATPCTEWNVRQLVNHMTQGNLNYIRLLDGGDRRGVPTNERRRCPGSGSAQRLRPVGTGMHCSVQHHLLYRMGRRPDAALGTH